MAAIHIRNVPEAVVAALRERATRHGQSVQHEVREILAAAAAEQHPGQPVDPVRLNTVRVGDTSTWTREEMYGDAGR